MEKQLKNITPEQALARLQRSCALRETCLQAVQRKLTLWGVAPQEAERIKQTLLDGKWVDNRRYAEAFAREKSRINKWGALKIRGHLQAKRIPAADIQHALSQVATGNEEETLRALLAKKAQTIRAASAHDFFAKLLRFGASRGYEYEQVAKVARAIKNEML